MSETIVAKFGGTSNATAEAVEMSMALAEDANLSVVSAPGKLSAEEVDNFPINTGDVPSELLAMKVTQLLDKGVKAKGEFPQPILDAITLRYRAIEENGPMTMGQRWYDAIPDRIRSRAEVGWDVTTIIGEALMAEMWQGAGFELFDIAEASGNHPNLGTNLEAWDAALAGNAIDGKMAVAAGNTTTKGGLRTQISGGGSDTKAGFLAKALGADLHINYTDGGARTADPSILRDRTRPIEHLTYIEGRELGLNGTGLVHPEAMIPLMIGNIPTEVRSTFDPDAPVTQIDNDIERAQSRTGGLPVALSLIKDVVAVTIHEPGMAEAEGRLAAFTKALAGSKINAIDSESEGFDWQTYLVESRQGEQATELLSKAAHDWATVTTTDKMAVLALVGYGMNRRVIDSTMELALNAGMTREFHEGGVSLFTPKRHSIRFAVESDQAEAALAGVHRAFFERD